jgi:hypothetical protein
MALDSVTEAKVKYYFGNHAALLQQILRDVPGIRVPRYDSVEEISQERALAELEFAALRRIEELYRPKLHDIVCVKFRYCDRRGSDLLSLALLLADAALSHGFPTYTAAILALKAGVLNRWCDCDKKP